MQMTPETIAKLLKQLLGRDVTFQKIAPFKLSAVDPSITASYVTKQGSLAGVWLCDLDLTYRAGAALCMIPAAEAQARLRVSKVDDYLVENFREILNICSQLFTTHEEPSVELGAVYLSAEERPPAIATLIVAPASRLDLQMTISGYGNGRMSILM